MAVYLTKADLRAGIKSWLSDSNVNDGVVDQAIALCEAQINAKTKLLQGVASSDLTIDSGTCAAPSGFRGARALHISNERLELVTLDRLLAELDAYPSGQPCYFALIGSAATALPVFKFAPSPDATYTGTLIYQKTFELATDAAYNYLLHTYPDTYLYGSLMHMRAKLQDPERLPQFQALFAEAIQAARRDDRFMRNGELQLRKTGGSTYNMGSGWGWA